MKVREQYIAVAIVVTLFFHGMFYVEEHVGKSLVAFFQRPI